jgi:hypothetical protein
MTMQATTEGRGKPQDSFAHRLAIQDRRRAATLSALVRLRKEASAEIHRLIAFLDASDPYVMTELEEEDDREEVGDSEPWLGSLDRQKDQTRWGAGCTDDAELDTADDEPSLGSIDCHSPEHHSQELWAVGGRSDLEQDDAESGIGDHDRLLEQIGTQGWQHGGMV